METSVREPSERKGIKRIFVPRNCLQGTIFPVHIQWYPNDTSEVRVRMPDGFQLVRLNNAVSFERTSPLEFAVREFEESGFLGVVVRAPLIPTTATDSTIEIQVRIDGGPPAKEARSIHVFRPQVDITELPEELVVRSSGGANAASLGQRIRVSNSGEGMALAVFAAREKSSVHVTEPDSATEFRGRFWDDLISSLSRSKAIPHDATRILRQIKDLEVNPPILTESSARRITGVYDRFGRILQANRDFARALYESAGIAYMNNIDVLIDVSILLDYLRSIESSRILLMNVSDVVRVKAGRHKLDADLVTFDLGLHKLDSVHIQLEVNSTRDAEIPIYELIRPTRGLELGEGRIRRFSPMKRGLPRSRGERRRG
jgi:hypothetical protein